jgi:cell division protein FtsI (penicillin-binding protein 3)
MADVREKMINRLLVVVTLLGILPLLIFFQIIRINWVNGDKLRSIGSQQVAEAKITPALRGVILDRQGRTLAYSDARYHLAIDPQLAGFKEKRQQFFQWLASVTGKPEAPFWIKMRQNKGSRYIILTGNDTGVPPLDESQKKQVDSWQIPGVMFEDRISRRYSYGTLAGSVLGYLAQGKGYNGIEQQFDTELHGIDGQRFGQKDSRGNIQFVSTGKVVNPRDGENLVLTIDLRWQSIIEEELAKKVQDVGAQWGTAVAVNPKTGEILAMANVPSYDPNDPNSYPAANQKNYAISNAYEPGSTFKLVTMMTAVDQGLIKMNEQFDGKGGYWNKEGVESADDHPYKSFSIPQAVAYSSNIVMAQISMRFKREIVYQYMRNLGFGQRTFIELPNEHQGDLSKVRDKWGISTRIAASRGYGITVTPLQLVMAYSAFANNGVLMQPYIVAERRSDTGTSVWRATPRVVRQVCKPETVKALMPAFEMGVEDKHGTGHPAFIEGLHIAGKTGTAQEPMNGKYSKEYYYASFVGMYPSNDPQIVLGIVLYRPKANFYGGETAAPVFGNIAARLLGALPEVSKQMKRPFQLPVVTEMPLPNVIGMPLTKAHSVLESLGFVVEMPTKATDWALVKNMSPQAGARINLNTPIQLEVEEPNASMQQTMPNLVGWDMKDAVNWLTARNVKVRAEGKGRIMRQSPSVGGSLRQDAFLYGN